MFHRSRFSCSVLAAVADAARCIRRAQTLKSGTLSLVVPFAAGGPSDVAGRILAQGLTETLGQTVVVENPVGGGGTVGSLRVSRSTPDGSQFVLGNNGTHSWSQSLYKNPPYDTIEGLHAARARGRSRRASSSCRRTCRPTRCRSSSPM